MIRAAEGILYHVAPRQPENGGVREGPGMMKGPGWIRAHLVASEAGRGRAGSLVDAPDRVAGVRLGCEGPAALLQ